MVAAKKKEATGGSAKKPRRVGMPKKLKDPNSGLAKKLPTSRTAKPKGNEAAIKTDAEILQLLKNEIVKQINGGTINMKVGDFLKILEIQRKLSSDSGATDKFWKFIEKIRQQELSDE